MITRSFSGSFRILATAGPPSNSTTSEILRFVFNLDWAHATTSTFNNLLVIIAKVAKLVTIQVSVGKLLFILILLLRRSRLEFLNHSCALYNIMIRVISSQRHSGFVYYINAFCKPSMLHTI